MAQEKHLTPKMRSWMLAAKVDGRGRGMCSSMVDHLTSMYKPLDLLGGTDTRLIEGTHSKSH